MKRDFVEEQLVRYRARKLAEKNEELARRVAADRSLEEAFASFRGLMPRRAEIRTKVIENV